MSLTTKEEISCFLKLYRETESQGINKEIAEKILMKEFQRRASLHENDTNRQL